MRGRFLHDYIEALSDLTVSGTAAVNGDIPVRGASSDSREIQPGWLFCAVRGSLQDGHQFIAQAIERGAVAVVAESQVPVPAGVAFIQVSDGYRAMGRVAECLYGSPAGAFHCIGITGTNGKTTCAFLLRELLRHHGRKCGMIGTVEYDLGRNCILTADRTTPTPFILQKYLETMAANQVEYGILEVSSHALAQGRLAGMKFSGAIFTNLTQDHLDYHGTLEAYYQCKRSLFLDMMEKNVAPVVINGDDSWGRRLAGELPSPPAYLIRKGSAGTVAGKGECVLIPEAGTGPQSHFSLRFADADWPFSTPLAGEYNLYNLASVICLVRCLGMEYEEIAEVVRTAAGAPGRLQACTGTGEFSVYVDYAHTDDAIVKALQALRPLCRHRLAIVFGCGGNRDVGKRPKMGLAASRWADRLYVTSDNPRREDPGKIITDILSGIPEGTDYCIEEDRRKAIALAVREAEAGDVILIAGKGHENYQEIQGIQYPFSDFTCVREVLKQ